jgi:hypothetical protein
VIKISSQAERPFFLIDLFPEDPTGHTPDIHIIRLVSSTFNVQKIVHNTQSPLEAFRIFISVLLKVSGAKPYPNLESVQLKKIKAFPTIREYENSLG